MAYKLLEEMGIPAEASELQGLAFGDLELQGFRTLGFWGRGIKN